MNSPTLMDTEAAAHYIGLKRPTLEAWRRKTQGPPWLKIGGAVRYRVEDLDAFLRRAQHAPERVAVHRQLAIAPTVLGAVA